MKTKRAFTLVELLVVVVIIGILSSLVTVGVMSAVQAAKRSKIAMEMHQISLALETYKNKFGEYPPDLWDKTAVVRHVKKRWPRFQLPTNSPPSTDIIDYQYWAIMKAISNVYQNPDKLSMINSLSIYSVSTTSPQFMDITNIDTPSSSACTLTVYKEASYIGVLPLWLGGFPNPDGKFAGFSADPESPFGKDYSQTPPRINNGAQVDTSAVGFPAWDANQIQLDTQDKDSVFYEMIIGKNVNFITTSRGIVVPVLMNRDTTANKDGSTPVPYVYFKSTGSNGGKTAYAYLSSSNVYSVKGYEFFNVFNNTPYVALGMITAYAQSGNVDGNNQQLIWHEAERFQLIHPGLDGVFGREETRPGSAVLIQLTANPTPELDVFGFRSTNTNINTNSIGQKDFDNITNFSDYQQIKSILP
jgi:prepilin-type N-terminal cleavage/methylation domain-containing protein